MSVDICNFGPCPFLKTTGAKLPQQPFKCYSCQKKRASSTAPPTPSALEPSCTSSNGSVESYTTASSAGSRTLTRTVTAPLPGVARQPAGTLKFCTTNTARPRSSSKSFSFTCTSSGHTNEYYLGLPSFLPHQDHPCPPCQLESLRARGDREVTLQAKKEFPHLRGEMLVRNGRIREDWESNLTLDMYIMEKRTEEKEMWLHVMRKWSQDLKKLRVLLLEEDGLGLMS
jgi:hypothetical protein